MGILCIECGPVFASILLIYSCQCQWHELSASISPAMKKIFPKTFHHGQQTKNCYFAHFANINLSLAVFFKYFMQC